MRWRSKMMSKGTLAWIQGLFEEKSALIGTFVVEGHGGVGMEHSYVGGALGLPVVVEPVAVEANIAPLRRRRIGVLLDASHHPQASPVVGHDFRHRQRSPEGVAEDLVSQAGGRLVAPDLRD